MSRKQVKVWFIKKTINNKIKLSSATMSNCKTNKPKNKKYTKIGILLNTEPRITRYNKINANTRFMKSEIVAEQKKIKQCPVCAQFYHVNSEHDPWSFNC